MPDLKNNFLKLHLNLRAPVRHDFIIPPPFGACGATSFLEAVAHSRYKSEATE